MCQYKSGVAIKSGEGVVIKTLKREDSHTKIRKAHNIRDGISAGASKQTPVEFIPVRGLFKIEDYDFVFDAGQPDWWTDEMTRAVKRQMFRAAKQDWESKTLAYKGNLDLGSLTTIPKGVTLKTGGYLDLGSLTTIPKGVTIKTGGSLYLSSLTTIPKGVTIKAGEYLDLRSLTTIPKGVTIKTGGSLDLRSLTTIPKGVTLKAKGYYVDGAWHKKLPRGLMKESKK